MKKIQILLVLLFVLSSASLMYAQVGRHEQPSDTIPIGGDQQKEKQDRMQSREQLAKELVALRDSIDTRLKQMNGQADRYATNVGDASKDRYKKAVNELTQHKSKLNQAIDKTSSSKNWSADMSYQTTKLMTDIRENFKRIRADFKD